MLKRLNLIKKKNALREILITINRGFIKHDPKSHLLDLDNLNLDKTKNEKDILNFIHKCISKDIYYLRKTDFVDNLFSNINNASNLHSFYKIERKLIENR